MNDPARRGSLVCGLRALKQGRLILALTATTAALALPSALALWPAMRDVFGGTLAGDHVLRNHPTFAPLDVFEFFYEKRSALAGARRVAWGAGGLGVLLQVLYAGGFVETLERGRSVTIGEFLAAAFRNFWHNLKCFLLFVLAAGLVLWIWIGATSAAGRKLFSETPPGAASSFAYRLATTAVILLLYAVLSLLHDFARIARRHDPSVGAWRGYGFARRTLSGSWAAALGLFFFWLVAGGAAWLALVALEWGLPAVSLAAILFHALLQVSAVILRSAVRVGAWGSYVAMSDGKVESRESRVEIPGTPAPTLVPEPLPPIDTLGEAPA